MLLHISSSALCFWQDLGENITDSISANVVNYTISIVPVESSVPERNITIMAHDQSSCTYSVCKYTIFNNLTEMSAHSYNVYVTAKNTLFDGHSEKKTCNNRPISKKFNVGLEPSLEGRLIIKL